MRNNHATMTYLGILRAGKFAWYIFDDLTKAVSERSASHCVQQKIDAEVRVVHKHGELLKTPQHVRR